MTTTAVRKRAADEVAEIPPTPVELARARHEAAVDNYRAMLAAELIVLTDMQLHHYKVMCDALGPATDNDLTAARQVVAQQKANGSESAEALAPLLAAYWAGRAAS